MESFYTQEVLPVKPVSDTDRRPKTWLLKRKKSKKVLKKLENKVQRKKTGKGIIDIYV